MRSALTLPAMFLLSVAVLSCARSSPPKAASPGVAPETLASAAGTGTDGNRTLDFIGKPTGDYTVGPEDVLEIKVFGEETLSRTTQVNSRGMVSLALLEEVHVAGLTREGIAKKLEEAYGADYLRSPQVFVTVLEYRSKTVQVLGAVKAPGVFKLRGPVAVLDVLALAGGISEAGGKNLLLLRPPTGEQSGTAEERDDSGTRFRGTIEPITVDVHRLLVEGDVSQNLEVRGGDTVFVPRADEIYVLGEVRNPGSVRFEEGMTLTQAISKTNGFTRTASKGKVQVVRVLNDQKSQFDVNVKRIEAGKEIDFVLHARDLVVVPESIF